MSAVTTTRTATHWGAYDVHVEDGRVVKLEPLAGDPDPAEIGGALADAFDHPTRIDLLRRSERLVPRPGTQNGWKCPSSAWCRSTKHGGREARKEGSSCR